MARLTRLSLTQFRNYRQLVWQPGADISVLTGPNGSGKTNLLEAISLLVPGRGMRGARIAELARRGAGATGAWAVAGRFEGAAGQVDIGTGSPPDGPSDRRVFRLDGQAPRTQAELAVHASAVWLTPQMDRLFQEGASGRRRFLDRLVYAVASGHAREVSAHDAAMVQRNRLLAGARPDPAWLAALEDTMARHAVAATAARASLIARLNATPPPGGFPQARLALLSPIADRLAAGPALAAEDWLRGALAGARPTDAAAGAAALGAHRADMALADAATGLAAAQASTGQQKALLIATVLAHAGLLAAGRGRPPLLLLDEAAVHLDAARREALCAGLVAAGAQVFLTGTDMEALAALGGAAEWLRVEDGVLRSGR